MDNWEDQNNGKFLVSIDGSTYASFDSYDEAILQGKKMFGKNLFDVKQYHKPSNIEFVYPFSSEEYNEL